LEIGILFGTVLLVAFGFILAKRDIHSRNARGDLRFVYSDLFAGEDGPRALSSGGGVVDGGGRPVQVSVDKTVSTNRFTLWTTVDAPPAFLCDLTHPNDVDERFRSHAFMNALSDLKKGARNVTRLSVSDRHLHVHLETEAFDHTRQEAVVALIDTLARSLTKLARVLDESFARGGFESRACPRCRDIALALKAGPLGEDRCPACQIHFLDAERAHVLCDELQVNPLELKSALASGRSEVVCAVCKTPMAPVLIEHTIVDLCRGCGAMLLDDGELKELRPHL
jgi:Zn-finger nucleic acid-binding protein